MRFAALICFTFFFSQLSAQSDTLYYSDSTKVILKVYKTDYTKVPKKYLEVGFVGTAFGQSNYESILHYTSYNPEGLSYSINTTFVTASSRVSYYVFKKAKKKKKKLIVARESLGHSYRGKDQVTFYFNTYKAMVERDVYNGIAPTFHFSTGGLFITGEYFFDGLQSFSSGIRYTRGIACKYRGTGTHGKYQRKYYSTTHYTLEYVLLGNFFKEPEDASARLKGVRFLAERRYTKDEKKRNGLFYLAGIQLVQDESASLILGLGKLISMRNKKRRR